LLLNNPEYHGWLRKEYESRKDTNIFAKLGEDEEDEDEEFDESNVYFNTNRAAKYLRINNVKLIRMARNHILPYTKAGVAYRFKKTDLDIYMKEGNSGNYG